MATVCWAASKPEFGARANRRKVVPGAVATMMAALAQTRARRPWVIRAFARTPFRPAIRPGGHFAMTKPAAGTFAARYERGVGLRRRSPREKHADLRPAKRDPVAILAQADRTRVPELIPESYKRCSSARSPSCAALPR